MENKKVNNTLLIIDGSSLLSTSFYGTATAYVMAKTDEAKEIALSKLLKTSDGRYTNGVYTFMKTLLSLIKTQKPSHMAIVWDISRNSFRKSTVNGDYKGTRKETPSPLKEQFKTTQELLQDLFPQYMSSFEDELIYEADDFAGSIAKRFETQLPTYLYTKDRDYLQLVSEYSRVWLVTSKCDEMNSEIGIDPKEFNLPGGVFEYTLSTLEHFEELEPYQIVEYKAIVGDSSDNIKGVSGVGPKAVLPLLQEYGTIDTLYEHIDPLLHTVQFTVPTDSIESTVAILKKATKVGMYQVIDCLHLDQTTAFVTTDNTSILEESKTISDLTKLLGYAVNKPTLEEPANILLKVVSTSDLKEFGDFCKNSLGISRNPLKPLLAERASAFESKQLATIKTDIPEIQDVTLEDLVVNINYELLNSRLLDLEMNSLINEITIPQTSSRPSSMTKHTETQSASHQPKTDLDDFINGSFYDPNSVKEESKEELKKESLIQISLF